MGGYAARVKTLEIEPILAILDRIVSAELSGVVRYTHYALMVTGPNRIPIVDFLNAQASESLVHAQEAGAIMTGFDGHPTPMIEPIEESHNHDLKTLLKESLEHEERALNIYRELLEAVGDSSVYLEEYARGQIAAEEGHVIELRKMLRDYGAN